MPTLLDSGAIIAAVHTRDSGHRHFRRLIESEPSVLLTSEACVTEAIHILKTRGMVRGYRRVFALLRRLQVEVVCLTTRLREIESLMEKYGDLPMDFADATLVDLAGQRSLQRVITSDRRDFSVYRLPSGLAFEIAGLHGTS
ncbi:MAG: PIN domain-containing protein [Dehalococcoidia bacterium]